MLIVGEYLSQGDLEHGGAFTDGLGMMFRQLLRQSGIEPRECTFLNVINSPVHSYFSLFSKDKADGIPGVRAVSRGEYLRAQYMPDVELLRKTIRDMKPNLVLTLGDLSLWAVTEESSIKNSRGRITHGNSGVPGQKVLPTYSARQIAQDYALRPIVLADLDKARRQSLFPEIIRPQRFIHLHPDLNDLEEFLQTYIEPAEAISVDIETKDTMITCVGVAPSPDRAIVVPFFTDSRKDGNYWRTAREEFIAWRWVKRVLSLGKPTFGQNFQFDAQHLWRSMGIKSPYFSEDTMIAHHSLYPELQKGLGFLASIYTDELSWKFMHKARAADKTVKRGD